MRDVAGLLRRAWRRLHRARVRILWHLRRAELNEDPEDAAWWQAIR